MKKDFLDSASKKKATVHTVVITTTMDTFTFAGSPKDKDGFLQTPTSQASLLPLWGWIHVHVLLACLSSPIPYSWQTASAPIDSLSYPDACLSKRCLDRHLHHEAGESTGEACAAVNKGQGEDQASRSMSVSNPKRGKERSAAGSAFVKSRLSLAAERTRVLNRSEGSKPLPAATENASHWALCA
ncbi:hypothetical protein [Paenibacillus sp. SI8]|uniref:hypothetical protein n=1 Tax=unclassified Paenibacillus TaxID=185978 RepID=UPI0034677F5B